jgi:hypothetical protein
VIAEPQDLVGGVGALAFERYRPVDVLDEHFLDEVGDSARPGKPFFVFPQPLEELDVARVVPGRELSEFLGEERGLLLGNGTTVKALPPAWRGSNALTLPNRSPTDDLPGCNIKQACRTF